MKEGYVKTAVGDIPVDWEVVKLGDIANTFAGGTPKRSISEYYIGNIPWVKSGEVDNNNILETEEHVSELAIKETATRLIKPDSILVALYGATAGKIGILKVEACSNQAVLAVCSKDNSIENEFLYHFLKMQTTKLLNLSQGSGQPNLSKSIVDGVSIPQPPLYEQQKIAEILSTVDEKIDFIDQQIKETQELKKGLMQRLLTKGIDHTEFKDSPLGEIPKSWEIMSLGNIGEFKNGINKSKEDFGHGYPMINLNDVFGVTTVKTNNLGLVNSTVNEREDYSLKKGDVLFIRSSVKPSGVGLSAVIQENLSNTVYSGFIIRFRDYGQLDNIFKKHCFYDTGFRNRLLAKSTVSANTNINQKALNTLLLSVPPKLEQQKIASILSSVDEKLEVLGAKKNEYKELKKGLMQVLLTGKVRVNI